MAAEAPPQSPPPQEHWCYHCDKRVSVETVANHPDVICTDCKNGFVESIPPLDTPSRPSDDQDDDAYGSPFLEMFRRISQAARDEDAPPHLPQNPTPEEDFLRIELDGWDNDEDDDDAHSLEFHNAGGGVENEEPENEVRSYRDDDYENHLNRDDDGDVRRRRQEVLRLRISDFARRASSGGGRARILDWAEILMGLDNSIELRFDTPDRYVGNPEDYVDAAGYEALLQTLAESDSSGRRGAPPSSKSVVSGLPAVNEASVCAICKDMVNVDEMSKKLPCGHGYHGDCIVPWLSTRNSCPVCRFELPTDDAEYEEERKKCTAVNVSGGGASGSGGGDSYVHRVGRTARAGKVGCALTFVTDTDRSLLKAIAKRAGSKLRSRIVAEQSITKWCQIIEQLEDQVATILREESEKTALRRAEMEAAKAENMIAHRDEIYSRPKRTWIVTEKEKKEVVKASKVSGEREKHSGREVISAEQIEELKMKEKRKREREKNLPRKKRRNLEAAREMLEEEKQNKKSEASGPAKEKTGGLKLVDLGYRRAKSVKAANKALETGKIVKDSKKSKHPPKRTQSRTDEMEDLFQSDMSLGKQNRKSGGLGKKKSKNSFKSKSRYKRR